LRQDERVKILSPGDNSDVQLPVTIDWSVSDDFRITGPDGKEDPSAGYFAVFVDREPPAHGRTLASLARGDTSCRVDEGCPDAAWFALRNVFPTSATEFIINSVPRSTVDNSKRFHRVAIILVDGTGRRIGESAFAVDFKVVDES